MCDRPNSASPGRLARRTGFFYAFVILAGVANEILVRNSLFIPGDSATTVNNILTHELVFRAGFLISLVRFEFFILMILALYRLFRPVDEDWSRVMAALALVITSIWDGQPAV
jgi:hypothetical protein